MVSPLIDCRLGPVRVIPSSSLTGLRMGPGEGSTALVLRAMLSNSPVAVKTFVWAKDPIRAVRHEATMYQV